MRKIVAFMMAVVMLFSSVGIGNDASFASGDTYEYNNNDYITLDDGSRKYYNKTLSKDQNFAVYGCPDDVTEHMNIKNVISDKKEYRYLGFNKHKEVITNNRFPDDFSTSIPFDKRNYVQKKEYKTAWIKDEDLDSINEARGLYENFQDDENGQPMETTKFHIKKIFDDLHLDYQKGTEYTKKPDSYNRGQIVLHHTVNGHPRYDTVEFPATEYHEVNCSLQGVYDGKSIPNNHVITVPYSDDMKDLQVQLVASVTTTLHYPEHLQSNQWSFDDVIDTKGMISSFYLSDNYGTLPTNYYNGKPVKQKITTEKINKNIMVHLPLSGMKVNEKVQYFTYELNAKAVDIYGKDKLGSAEFTVGVQIKEQPAVDLKIEHDSKDVTDSIIKVSDMSFSSSLMFDIIDSSNSEAFTPLAKQWQVMNKSGTWSVFSTDNVKQVPFTMLGTDYLIDNRIYFRLRVKDHANNWHTSDKKYVRFSNALHPDIKIKRHQTDVTNTSVKVSSLLFSSPMSLNVVDVSDNMGFVPVKKSWEVMKKDGSFEKFSSTLSDVAPFTIAGTKYIKDDGIYFRLGLFDGNSKWHFCEPRYVRFYETIPSTSDQFVDAELWANGEHDYLKVMVGESIKLDGSQSTCNKHNKITNYSYYGTGDIKVKNQNLKKTRGYYPMTGQYELMLDVMDKYGNKDTSNVIDVKVVEPVYDGQIKVSGTLKENRRIDLEMDFQKPQFLRARDILWSITPLDGQSDSGIYIRRKTREQTAIQIQKMGRYKVSYQCKLEPAYNPAGLSYDFSTSKDIEISEDKKPIVKYHITKKAYRDPNNRNKVTLDVTNLSYSEDHDEVLGADLYVIYDENDNGQIDEGEKKRKILRNFTGSRRVTLSEWVGNLFFYMEAKEHPSQKVLFWKREYDKVSNSREHMSLEEEHVLVDNVAPFVLLDPSKKKKIQMVVATDKTRTDRTSLHEKIEELRVDLIQKGYELEVYETDKMVRVQRITDVKRHYDRNLMVDVYVKRCDEEDIYDQRVQKPILPLINEDVWDSDISKNYDRIYGDYSVGINNISTSKEYFNSNGGYYGHYRVYDLTDGQVGKWMYRLQQTQNTHHKDPFYYEGMKDDRVYAGDVMVSDVMVGGKMVTRDVDVSSIDVRRIKNYRWDEDAYKRILITSVDAAHVTSEYKEDFKKFLDREHIDLYYSGDLDAVKVPAFSIGHISDVNNKNIVKTVEGLFYKIYDLNNNPIMMRVKHSNNEFYYDGVNSLMDRFHRGGINAVRSVLGSSYDVERRQIYTVGSVFVDNDKKEKLLHKLQAEYDVNNPYYPQHGENIIVLGDGIYHLYNNLRIFYEYDGYDYIFYLDGKRDCKKLDEVKRVFSDSNNNMIYENDDGDIVKLFFVDQYGYNEKFTLDHKLTIDVKDNEQLVDIMSDVTFNNTNLSGFGSWGKPLYFVTKDKINGMFRLYKNGVFHDQGDNQVASAVYVSDIDEQRGGLFYKDGYILYGDQKILVKDDCDYIRAYDGIYEIDIKNNTILQYQQCSGYDAYNNYVGCQGSTTIDVVRDINTVHANYFTENGITNMMSYFTKLNLTDYEIEHLDGNEYLVWLFDDICVSRLLQPSSDGFYLCHYPFVHHAGAKYMMGRPKRKTLSPQVAIAFSKKMVGFATSYFGNYHDYKPVKTFYKEDKEAIALNRFSSNPNVRFFRTDDEIVAYIKKECPLVMDNNTIYVLQDEEIQVDAYFEDWENDDLKGFHFLFTHKPTFDNNEGVHPYSGVDRGTATTRFHHVGIYDTTARTQDDVMFDRYDYYSKMSANYKIIVHRKPIAKLGMNLEQRDHQYVVSLYDNGSYDPDYELSRVDKGIINKQFMVMSTDTSGWIPYEGSGIILKEGLDYKFSLRVQDVFGQWSDYDMLSIDKFDPSNMSLLANINPSYPSPIAVGEHGDVYAKVLSRSDIVELKAIYDGKSYPMHFISKNGLLSEYEVSLDDVPLDKADTDPELVKVIAKNKAGSTKEVILKMNIMTPVSISGEIEDGYRGGDILITAQTPYYMKEASTLLLGTVVNLEKIKQSGGSSYWRGHFRIPQHTSCGIKQAVFTSTAYNGKVATNTASFRVINKAPIIKFKNMPNEVFAGKSADFSVCVEDEDKDKMRVSLWYSTDDGASFTELQTIDNALSGTCYPVSISNVMGSMYIIKAQVIDENGASSEVTGSFDVVSNRTPSIHFVSHTPNEVYEADDVDVTLAYADPDDDEMDLLVEYSTDGEDYETAISKKVHSGDGSFTITSVDSGTIYLRASVSDGYETAKDTMTISIQDMSIQVQMSPDDPMAGDALTFQVKTRGKVEQVKLLLEDDIITNDRRVQMGYQKANYPIVVNMDPSKVEDEAVIEYILWVSTPQSLSLKGRRLRKPYTFRIEAIKGDKRRKVDIIREVQGDVRELIKIGTE